VGEYAHQLFVGGFFRTFELAGELLDQQKVVREATVEDARGWRARCASAVCRRLRTPSRARNGYAFWRAIGSVSIQQSLNREVAVKILSPALAVDSAFAERFVREARIAGGFRHRHRQCLARGAHPAGL